MADRPESLDDDGVLYNDATCPIASIFDLENSIQTLLVFLDWESQLADYRKSSSYGQHCHIFRTMVVLDNWMAGSSHDVEYYLKGGERT